MTQTTVHRPVRIRLHRTRGWRMPADAKSVARPHRWGNPYTEEDHGRDEAIRLFEADLRAGELRSVRGGVVLTAEDARRELAGWLLACFCPLDAPCHADVLLRIANEDGAA